MPTFGTCRKLVNFSVICWLFVIHINAVELANQDEDELSYCMLAPHEEGKSTFTLGDKEYLVCRRGNFFDYTPNEQGNPKGCTRCRQNDTHMSSRNFCPQCKACRDCNENQEEIPRSCTATTDRICIPRSPMGTGAPFVTGGSAPEATTNDSTTGPRFTTEGKSDSTYSPCSPCQQCVPCTTSHQSSSETPSNRQEQQCMDKTALIVSCSILAFTFLTVVLWLLIRRFRRTCKKKDGDGGKSPAPTYQPVTTNPTPDGSTDTTRV